MNSLDLTGLRARHPLGFLAACGLLRCLNQTGFVAPTCRGSKGFGEVKLGWSREDGEESFAVIYSEDPIDIAAVACTVRCAAAQWQRSPAWTWSIKIDKRTKYRQVSQTAVRKILCCNEARDAADMLAALASDMLAEKDTLRKTAFDLTSANQRLLKMLISVAEGVAQSAEGRFEEALKGPWRYRDGDHSLGWDPETQRLHALRGKAPGNDKENRSVRVAVLLASLALPMFPCFAVGGKLRTTGFHRHGNDEWFAWPVWREPISLATLHSLLSHHFNGDLGHRGVDVVYQSRVSHTGGSQGNYQIFSHSEERRRPWADGDRM